MATQPEPRDEQKVEAEQPKLVEVVVTDSVVEEKKEEAPKPAATPRNSNRRRAATTTAKAASPAENAEDKIDEGGKPPPARPSTNRRSASADTDSAKVDPMAGINLVIYFKDGSRLDRPMTEVQRFSVERAVLTVISKNGTIGRYNMIEVSRVSIE